MSHSEILFTEQSTDDKDDKDDKLPEFLNTEISSNSSDDEADLSDEGISPNRALEKGLTLPKSR